MPDTGLCMSGMHVHLKASSCQHSGDAMRAFGTAVTFVSVHATLCAAPADDSEYWQRVSTPMDLSTLLSHIDGGRYATTAAFLADCRLIVEVGRGG